MEQHQHAQQKELHLQHKPARILSIAGSDSSGGAGIQADLKTFMARKTYGMSVITALTSQNTLGVQAVLEISPDFIAKQIDSVISDMGVDCIKIGMLANKEIVKCVVDKLVEYKVKNIVVDPVMVATSGDVLLKKEAVDNLKHLLFPIATIVTPNIPEALQITNMKEIKSIEQMKEAARIIAKFSPKYVLIKGGHLHLNGSNSDEDNDIKQATDVLYEVETDIFQTFTSEIIVTNNTHGTGCTLAACIAAEIGKGFGVADAVTNAKEFITNVLEVSSNIHMGTGSNGPLMHHSVILGDD